VPLFFGPRDDKAGQIGITRRRSFVMETDNFIQRDAVENRIFMSSRCRSQRLPCPRPFYREG